MAPTSDPSRGGGIVALCIFMMILSTTAIALRIWSRLTFKNRRFWWDDWFAIASLPFVLATLSIVLRWTSDGYGHHASQVTPADFAQGLKYLYALTFTFDLGITLPKYSAILFYIRIFQLRSKLFQGNAFVGLGLVTAWVLFAIISTIFQCTPVRKAWLPLTPGHCISFYRWFLGSAITNVIIDVFITVMPLPVLWKLHTGRSRKVILTGFFFCAYCVLLVSVGRLVAIVKAGKTLTDDLTWNGVSYLHWVVAEVAVSVVSISLPNITHLIQRAREHGLSALFTNREFVAIGGNYSKSGASSGLAHKKEGFQRFRKDGTLSSIDNELITNQGGSYSVRATAPQESGKRDIALGQVHMRHDISVTENDRWAPV